MKNKKIKIIVILIITLIIGLLGYSQVIPIIVKKPSEDFTPISIKEAKISQDNNMALSFLYNITKEKHPTGSQEIYKVRDYITECLKEIDVKYDVSTQNLDEYFFTELKNERKELLNNLKNDYYNYFKEYYTEDGDVDKVVKEKTQYDSFDEWYKQEFEYGKGYEITLEEKYEKEVKEFKNQTLNNIIVQLNSNNNQNAQNIMFVSHYDSASESYGAGDDGMCVAGLLETIRCLKDKKCNNNIFVMFTDGEEQNFWGATEFIKKNDIKLDLIINFDNSGNSGNLILYNYSNDSLTKQYFKAVNKESSYSFVNELLYNPDSTYYQGETSDASVFTKNGYNTIDLALVGNPFYYHSQKDNFYNVDTKSLENLTKSMIEMMTYYGNNTITLEQNEALFNFKLLNGVEFSIPKKVYIIIAIIFIATSCIYIVTLFTRKKKIIQGILAIILTVASIVTLVLFKNFSLLFSIPCIVLLISEFIKCKKAKHVFLIILFESYFFVVIQLIIQAVQYTIWLKWIWQ